ncbi:MULTISPECIES: REP-associated tyrosine transposase [Pseudanabaena]|jgi:putative transposase|uniref:REP-associated tyrosine transposase n=1 Tax=Pseudanabaena TaxID=1152 RepID=UPI002478B469|nr:MULTISPECIES: transposase [Pseudanabaena]MEA5487894.1 transposase [Pseudanabaena sp. CCNP1317]WGS72198.1 transposase [Pseudanabaena galeata CCNP1313]
MSNYRRPAITGGTYFITQVTYQRIPWLCSDLGRKALREAIAKVREKYPFEINAFVLLPEHFHCLWTLPEGDKDFSVRLRLIKTYVTKHYGEQLGINAEVSRSRQKRQEKNLWQRRFWEHLIRDERDYALHCDYIHYNPVRHGLCVKAEDWQFSSIHRFIAQGQYPPDWGVTEIPEKPQDIWDE